MVAVSITRAYVPRANQGGNYCGHNPDSPRLELVAPTTLKTRPKILSLLQKRIQQYYGSPTRLPSLRSANRSKQGRQQRSERREACLLLLTAILEFTDLSSLRCGVPTADGFVSLTLNYLVQFTGLHPRRAERALADLKRANLLTVAQPRQLLEDGSWRGLAAVKAVNKLLFTAFGLGRRLQHERDRATKRLVRKTRTRGTLTTWARNALVLNTLFTQPGRSYTRQQRAHPQMGEDLARRRLDMLLALRQEYPSWSAEQINQEVDRLVTSQVQA
ncbi:hypothetical protein LCGC14_0393400 [marine sediment metagenome]|uniref:Uncharacterized protein n=3 Tax=root TaxID=1 RepID=A0A7V1BM30_9GAMM|nr:hypothetical protein [Marinobacter antarcticus]HDZ55295.1 hypothetical protein [Halopseudomonas xinjiangensis]HEA51683.1 hypothetical protein [Marinobacter antarcticus]